MIACWIGLRLGIVEPPLWIPSALVPDSSSVFNNFGAISMSEVSKVLDWEGKLSLCIVEPCARFPGSLSDESIFATSTNCAFGSTYNKILSLSWKWPKSQGNSNCFFFKLLTWYEVRKPRTPVIESSRPDSASADSKCCLPNTYLSKN